MTHPKKLKPQELNRRNEEKNVTIRVRVSVAQRRVFACAAQNKGLDVSTWLRMIGIEQSGVAPQASA